MAHLHKVRDLDTHYAIDPITMAITNANEAKNKLMLGDHGSEIYTFEIPKEIEGHDMTLCNCVEVHFINVAADKANQSSGVYLVDDMAIAEDAEDMLVFTWPVSGVATMYAGYLNYRIKFACTDENGNYTYRKWTDVYKGISIADGFDNGEVIETEYSDIIAAWGARLDTLEEDGGARETRIDALEQGSADCVNRLDSLESDSAAMENRIAVLELGGGVGGDGSGNVDAEALQQLIKTYVNDAILGGAW